MQPLVSVIMPTYNAEKYIGDAIESILNQTYKNIEVIIVDDASTDETGNICDVFASKDDRITCVHHSQNAKLWSTRNTGLENANGEYVVFVDGDDWLADDFVEYMYNLIEKYDNFLIFLQSFSLNIK